METELLNTCFYLTVVSCHVLLLDTYCYVAVVIRHASFHVLLPHTCRYQPRVFLCHVLLRDTPRCLTRVKRHM